MTNSRTRTGVWFTTQPSGAAPSSSSFPNPDLFLKRGKHKLDFGRKTLGEPSNSCWVSLHRVGFSRPPLRDHPVFSSVADWLVGANKLLQAWSDLIHESDGDPECVHKHLIRVLVKLMFPKTLTLHLGIVVRSKRNICRP